MATNRVSTTTALTEELLRTAYGMFPSGVTAIAAEIDAVPVGMAASTFTSVSLDPPLVSICIARSSTTWPALRTAPVLGVSVLSSSHGTVARSLASKKGNRFEDIDWTTSDEGALFVHGSSLWIECTIWNEFSAGDHDIAVLEIQRIEPYPDVDPLLFHASRFRSLAD